MWWRALSAQSSQSLPRMLFRLFVILFSQAAGHGSLTNPPPRTGQTMKYAGVCPGMWVPTPIGPAPRPSRGDAPQNGTCDWYNQGCQPGCSECNVKCSHIAAAFGKCCASTMKPTLNDPKLRTYQNFGGIIDIGFKYNPWRSPGFAPVMDPCGVITGNQAGEHVDGAPKPGTRGSSLPASQGPKWAAGSQQDVSWSLYANHGGGYAYRLCPKTSKLSEDCFQKQHLQFVGSKSWIHTHPIRTWWVFRMGFEGHKFGYSGFGFCFLFFDFYPSFYFYGTQ